MSHSMDDDMMQLKSFASKLHDKLAMLSNNYQLGFGSFVDKDSPPIAQLREE